MLERWISPCVFSGTNALDEYSLVRELGAKEAWLRLEAHRKSFITKKHIRRIKELGLDAVRVPVGYWLFDDVDGFIGGGFRYIDALFEWAKEYNVDVLLCVHAVQGSQNGDDHSGRAGKRRWFITPRYRENTIQFVERLAERYGQQPTLLGIELVNEPRVKGWWDRWVLTRYYLRAGRIVESRCHKRVRVVMSDAFQMERMIPRLVGLPLGRPVADTHLYQLFSPEDRRLDVEGHIARTSTWFDYLLTYSQDIPVVVGEWSAAMNELPDPGQAGQAKKRRYEPSDYVRFARAQRRVFDRAHTGWFYWTARTEDRGVWSLLDHPELLEK